MSFDRLLTGICAGFDRVSPCCFALQGGFPKAAEIKMPTSPDPFCNLKGAWRGPKWSKNDEELQFGGSAK